MFLRVAIALFVSIKTRPDFATSSIQKYPDSPVHTVPNCLRMQKCPLWRAGLKKVADSNAIALFVSIKTRPDFSTSSIQKYPDSPIHTVPNCLRMQNFPLWRADSKSCGFACEFAGYVSPVLNMHNFAVGLPRQEGPLAPFHIFQNFSKTKNSLEV